MPGRSSSWRARCGDSANDENFGAAPIAVFFAMVYVQYPAVALRQTCDFLVAPSAAPEGLLMWKSGNPFGAWGDSPCSPKGPHAQEVGNHQSRSNERGYA